MMTSKKVLIITYYWPPAGGPGVQRWLKFSTYLPQYGYDPIVYCPENPSYPIIDQSLTDDIPETVTIVKQPIKEPYSFAKLFSRRTTTTLSSGIIPHEKSQSFLQKVMLYVRGNLFIPDARKMWIKPSITFLVKYIQQHNIETIITTGPPHSLHLIGLGLKSQLNLRWIADFRDPWTTIGYHKSLKLTSRSKAKHQTLENRVLTTADHIVVTSNHTKTEFSSKTTKPITVITNGYDTHSIPKPDKDELFTLTHVGSLLSERNPEVLWKVLSELAKENEDFSRYFRLRLTGIVGAEIIDNLERYSLKDSLEIVGYVEHDEAIAHQMRSQVLLLIETDSEETKAIIPGKLFEYMASETPILAIGPEHSDIEGIITSTQTGSFFTCQQKSALKAHIAELFEAYLNGRLKVQPIHIEAYSRKVLTGKLASLL